MAGSSGRSSSVSSRSTRSTSRSSSTCASRRALPSSIASAGSMNRVPALPLSSWTIPPGRLRESRRTGMTYRPPRTVTVASAGAVLPSRPRSSDSSFRSSRFRAACTSRLAAASRGLAVSSKVPSASTDCSRRRSSAFAGSGRASAAASGAVSSTRRRSACISRAATSTRWRAASSAPSSTLPSILRRPSVRVTSGMGSASSASPRRKSAATSPARASSPLIQPRSSVGRRARTRAAPSGPTTCAATSSTTWPNSIVSSASALSSGGKGDGVPPCVWAGTPWGETYGDSDISSTAAPRERSG